MSVGFSDLIQQQNLIEGNKITMVVGGNKVEVILEESVRDEFIHEDTEDSYVGLLIGAVS